MKIFISYSHAANSNEARSLAIGMTQHRNYTVFHDRNALGGGDAFHAKIREEIDTSDLFVFLISPEAIKRGCYSLSELKFAMETFGPGSGRILPVVAAPTVFADIPPELKELATFCEPEGNLTAEVMNEIVKLSMRLGPRDGSALVGGGGEARSGTPPSLLAYLVNRDAQREQIRATLPDPWTETAPRFVCYVVGGHKDDLHKSLVERYVNFTLPNHLSRPGESFKDDLKTVSWPKGSGSADSRLERLLRDILEPYALLYLGSIPDIKSHFAEQFSGFFASYKTPATVCINVREDRWDAESEEIFAALLEVLGNVKVAHGVIFTVFVFAEYADAKEGFLAKFSRKKQSPMQRFVAELEDGSQSGGAIVLPELTPVSESDVRDWADALENICAFVDRDAVIDKVGTLFENAKPEMRYGAIIRQLKAALKGAAA